MPVVDIPTVPILCGETAYPEPFDAEVAGRLEKDLSRAAELSNLGIRLQRLEPGAWSAQRHWHENQDEFVYMLAGEAVLIEEDGETVLRPGNAVGFKAGVSNGHHLVNRTKQPATYLVVNSLSVAEKHHYPDVDLVYKRDAFSSKFIHKEGSPYPKKE